jgi:hypothetical protein
MHMAARDGQMAMLAQSILCVAAAALGVPEGSLEINNVVRSAPGYSGLETFVRAECTEDFSGTGGRRAWEGGSAVMVH